MKKILTFLIILILSASMFSCGKNTVDLRGEEEQIMYDTKVEKTDDGFVIDNGSVNIAIGADGVISEISSGELTVLRNDSVKGEIQFSTAKSAYDAKSFSKKKIESAKAVLSGDHVRLESYFMNGKVKVLTEIRTSGHEIFFENTVINNSDGVVASVNVPAFDNIQKTSDGILYFPNRNGGILEDPLGENLTSDPLQMRYPLPLGAQFLTYAGEKSVVSIRTADSKMGYKEFYFGGENHELNVNVYCFTEPNNEMILAPTVLYAGNGNWMDAGVCYQRWFDSWAKKPLKSEKLSDFPVITETRSNWKPLESENVQPESLSSIRSKINMQYNQGFEGTELVTWWGGPDNPYIGEGIPNWQDLNYPDYEYPSTIGDAEGLAAFIESVQISGMQLGFYTNARLGSDTSSYGMAKIREWKVKPANNAPIADTEDWWLYHYYVMCPGADGYYDAYFSRLEEFADAGLDFAQLDQIGAADSFLCFDKTHSHSLPQYAWSEGYTKFLKRVEKLTEKTGIWFWTEGTWEGAVQYVQLSQKGNWGIANQDVQNMKDFPELFMFVFPTYKLSACSAWYGGIPMWSVMPNSDEVKLQKANAEFYCGSAYRADYGLIYDRSECEAVYHINGDKVMLLVRGLREDSAGKVTVSVPKDLLNCENIGSFSVQGRLDGVNVSETEDYIVLTVNLSGEKIGGALLTVE
ncbi:MAG: DUF6259 domain-containing protein [Christensenellales bacterium]